MHMFILALSFKSTFITIYLIRIFYYFYVYLSIRSTSLKNINIFIFNTLNYNKKKHLNLPPQIQKHKAFYQNRITLIVNLLLCTYICAMNRMRSTEYESIANILELVCYYLVSKVSSTIVK